MAHTPGDSTLDDQSSLNYFMTWALNMTGSQSPAETNDSQKDTQVTGTEAPLDQIPLQESKQAAAVTQERTETNGQGVVDTGVPKALALQDVNDHATATGGHTVSDKNNAPYESSVPSSARSVAHKATKKVDAMTPTPAAVNKLDYSPEADAKRSLSSMTPTQVKLFQKVDLQQFKEYRDEQKTPAATQPATAASGDTLKDASLSHSNETASTQQPGDASGQPELAATESKKASGLLGSIHARPGARNFHYGVPTGSSPQHQAPFVSPKVGPSPVVDGEKRDPMEYFDNKQKEYYPPLDESTISAKRMLQSKDPNALMKSPKKNLAKLNPQAKEYPMIQQFHLSIADNEKSPGHDFDKTLPVLAVPEVEDSSHPFASEPTNGSNTVAVPPSSKEDTTSDSILAESAQAEQPTNAGEKASSQSQDDHRSENGLDLTPMLNVLDARTIKASGTSSQKMDNDLIIKTEAEEISTWGKREHPAKQESIAPTSSRTLILNNLPENSDYSLVQSLIEGAMVLSMKLNREERCARVKLVSSEDCQRLIESCGDGKEVKHKGKLHTIFIERSLEMDERDDVLDAYLDCGATRAVAVEGIDLDLTMRALFQLASGSSSSREVEGINDSFNAGVRKVVFRFTSVHDAVSFRTSLRRDIDWKDKKVEFTEDPCA